MSCSKEQPNPSASKVLAKRTVTLTMIAKDMVLRLLLCIACFVIQDLSDALPMVFKAGIALGPEIAVFLAFQRKWASILMVLGVMAYAKLQKYDLQAPALHPDASKPTDTTCEAGSTNASTTMTQSKTSNVLDGHKNQEISTEVSTMSKTSDTLDGHQNQETSTEVSTMLKTSNALDGHQHQETSTEVSTMSKTSDTLDGHQNQETSTEVSTMLKTSNALDGHQHQETSTEVSTMSKTSNALDGHNNQETSTEVSTMSKASNASDGHQNQETSAKVSTMSKISNGLNGHIQASTMPKTSNGSNGHIQASTISKASNGLNGHKNQQTSVQASTMMTQPKTSNGSNGHNNQAVYRNNNRRQNNGPNRNRCGNKERFNTPPPRQSQRPTPQSWANHHNIIMAKDMEDYKENRAKAKEMEGQRITINETYVETDCQVNGTRNKKEAMKETLE